MSPYQIFSKFYYYINLIHTLEQRFHKDVERLLFYIELNYNLHFRSLTQLLSIFCRDKVVPLIYFSPLSLDVILIVIRF